MSATAENLRDLHALHQRAKALRDRLASDPKTLDSRRKTVEARKAAVEQARKTLMDLKARNKKNEMLLQGQLTRVDDLKVKLNSARKSEEYKAIQNQIAHDLASIGKIENEILEGMMEADERTEALSKLEAEFQDYSAETERLATEIAARSIEHREQLIRLEEAIVGAEAIIPPDHRDQYRRIVKQRKDDAFAAVEDASCTGCFVAVTPQMINDLINVDGLVFCKTCGRILYLADEVQSTTRRKVV